MRLHHDLVFVLVKRELKVRYRGSFLGAIWTMLQPLLMMLVLHTVFSAIFRFSIKNYPVYALTGVLFWNFFSQSITNSMNSLRGNAILLRKVAVPYAVFPFAAVVSGVVNLVLALVPLLALLIVTDHKIGPALLFLPVAIAIALLFTLGAGLALSPLAVFFTDVIEFVTVLLTLTMYLTPVFYPKDILPDHFYWIVHYNPIRSVLEVFRDPIYLSKIPPIQHLSVALLCAMASFAIGVWIYRKSERRIAFFV
ncbi:MAG: ABC transporter permease [Acidobacteria bacterium]|mgnify:CR=1 FL=1|nr:MAG: ABC transporter permease [Acidobacteriota bacterium]REK07971.1 MAG: ABC transporter permease [Acidobacteriota bacterium]